MNNKRILIIGPNTGKASGLETFINNLIYSGVNKHYDFTVINDYFGSTSFLNKFFYSVNSLFEILRTLSKSRFSAVQIHCNSIRFSFYFKIFQVIICKLLSVKVITRFGSGASYDYFDKGNFIEQIIFSLFFKMQDAIIVQSETSQIFYSKFINVERIYPISNFVPDSNILSKKDISEKSKLNLMFVSGSNEFVARLKGAYVTANLILNNRDSFNDYNIFCIFPNKEFIDFCKLKKIFDKIVFLPLLRTEKIHKFYSQMDVFLFLAKNEAMPNTIIELLCYGTSIITTDSGSIKDIVDNNKGGFIVNRKDEELILKKIKELKSTDVRQSFSNHNVNKFKNNFSEDIAIIHFKKLYKEVIDA